MKAFEDSQKNGNCSLLMYSDYISKSAADKKESVIQSALSAFPTSALIWIELAKLNPSHEIYLKASQSVADTDALALWSHYISWSIESKCNPVAVFQCAMSTRIIGHDKLVLQFIDWCFESSGIQSLRVRFDSIAKSIPISYESIMHLISIELKSLPLLVDRINSLFYRAHALNGDVGILSNN